MLDINEMDIHRSLESKRNRYAPEDRAPHRPQDGDAGEAAANISRFRLRQRAAVDVTIGKDNR